MAYLTVNEARGRKAPSTATSPRADSEQLIRRTCLATSGLGAGTASAVTAAEMTLGEAASIVAIPLAGAAVGGDMMARTLLHVHMVCRLGELSGVHFGPSNAEELAMLYTLALGALDHPESDDPGRELLGRTLDLEARLALRSLGSEALGESVLRNVFPFVNILASPVASWRLTARLGRFFGEYFIRRRILAESYGALVDAHPPLRELALEGVWFLFIADGRLSPLETALLAGLVRGHPGELRGALSEVFVVDESGWLSRLAAVHDPVARTKLVRMLHVAAAVDARVAPGELEILRSVARALDQPWQPEAIHRLVEDVEAHGRVAHA